MHHLFYAQVEAWTSFVILKQFRPWPTSRIIVIRVLTWSFHFPPARRTTSYSDPIFVPWICARGKNQSQTFRTVWRECFTTGKCVRMGYHVEEPSHKFLWWRKQRSPVHVHYTGQYWTISCREFGYRGATIDDVQISHGSIHGIIQDHDGFRRILSSGIRRRVVH